MRGERRKGNVEGYDLGLIKCALFFLGGRSVSVSVSLPGSQSLIKLIGDRLLLQRSGDWCGTTFASIYVKFSLRAFKPGF